jgi:hypothetical protein
MWHSLVLGAATVAAFGLYVEVELHRNGALGFPLDDPWIHLKFARNMAHGWGLAFNEGEPVAGSSAPLWTVILAFFHLCTRSPVAMVWIAKLLGAGFLLAAGMFADRTVLLLTRNRWAGLGAGLALVLLGPMDWAMVSGMEVTLAVFLAVAGIYCWVEASEPQARPSSRWWSGLPAWALFALAVYARPEAPLLAGFALVDLVVRRLAFGQKTPFWRGLLLYFVLLVPYFALNLSLAHSLFPQTYVAKVGRVSLFAALASGDPTHLSGLLFRVPFMYFGGFAEHLWRANPVLVLLALVGAVTAVRQVARGRGSLLIPLVALLYAPALGMVAPYVAPVFQNGRYLGPPAAAVMLLSALGAWRVWSWCGPFERRWVPTAIVALAGFNAISVGMATARNTAQAESSINRMQVAVGHWLNQYTPQDAVIACNDVGAIGYFADRHVLDLLGLVTPEVATFRSKQPLGDENLGALEFVLKKKPDYLAIFPDWFPNLGRAMFLTQVFTTAVPDNTASKANFEPSAQTLFGLLITGLEVKPMPAVMSVYHCDWSMLESNQTATAGPR